MTETFGTTAARRREVLALKLFTVVAGAGLMTLAAKVQIPFWPVPMTLHTMAVMAFAVMFGPRLAASIFIAYLSAGALGLPVFSGTPERGIGLAYMVGPTCGYLIGFLVTSWLVGALSVGRGFFGRIGAMLTGLLVVYGVGAAWLAAYLPADKLFAVGIAPFVVGDLVKIGLVATIGLVLPSSVTRFWAKHYAR